MRRGTGPVRATVARWSVLVLVATGVIACSSPDDNPTAVRSDDVAVTTPDTPADDTTPDTVPDGTTAPAGSTTVPGGTTPTDTTPLPPGAKAWTVLVYLAADNNLEAEGVVDLEEMATGASNDMNILVLMDRAAETSDTAGYSSEAIPGVGDWIGAKLMSVTPAGITDLGSVSGDYDMTDSAVLEQFLTIGLTQFPAQHTALVLWDHGGGWTGFSQDESLNPRNTMQPDQVAAAMSQAETAAGHGKVDVLSFDACLMANLEVADVMNPVADYLIASEEVVPGHGMDYTVLASAVAAGDPVDFSTAMIDAFYAQSQAYHDDSGITMSLIDLAAMPAVLSSVSTFATALNANMTNDAVSFARAAKATATFGYESDPSYNFDLHDLGQLMTGFTSTDPNVSAAQAGVTAAMSSAVVLHTEGSSFTGATGLSVYIPSAQQYYRQEEFEQVSDAGPWSSLLDTFFATGTDLSGKAGFGFGTGGAPTATFTDTGINITASLDPTSIGTLASATAVYGFYSNEEQTLVGIGAVPATILDASTGSIGADTPAYNLVFTDGTKILIAFFSVVPSPGSDVTTLSSPVVYLAPGITDWHDGQLAYLVMTLAADGTVVQFAAYAPGTNGALGELTMDPTGTIETLLPLYEPDGAFEYVSTADYAGASVGTSLPSDLATIQIYVQTVTPADGIFGGDTPLGVGITATDVGGVTLTQTALVPT